MADTRPTADLHIHPRADVVPFPDPIVHEQMAADVERRGIVTPLDILADGTVLDGRTRLSIARVLGLGEVPVRVVETDDPFDFMVRAAFMRRDLKPSQRAALALELPEYRVAKEKAAERQSHGQTAPHRTLSVDVRKASEPPVHAATVAAEVAGVSTSYVEKADYVRQRDPDLFEQVKAGEVTVDAAKKAVKAREEQVPPTKESSRRIAAPKRTRPLRPWARHFTKWCRASLPEDRPVLLEMAREIDQALQRIGATR